jgi:anti-sigma factor ChrR (cupin superfamily)
MIDDRDTIEFDDLMLVALASSTAPATPSPDVKRRLMAQLGVPAAAPLPAGFTLMRAAADEWLPHPIDGIRMKVLALNSRAGYATLLLDVAPGTRFPPHPHTGGAEECYVISGSLHTLGRHLTAGDFLHADEATEHSELWTEEGCQVLLVVPPEDYMSPPVD